MANSDGFHLTLPSDGSMETFPDNTLAHFKTLLPQTLDLSEGEWEVGLTEMMFPNNLENIDDVTEAMVDILIPTHLNVRPKDPNIYETGRYQLINLGRQKIIEALVLVPWEKAIWTTPIDSGSEADLYRVKFRGGPYLHPQALIEEINEGLRRCLSEVWKKFPTEVNFVQEVGSMQLVFKKDYSRIEYQINGEELSRLHLCIRFPPSLNYKLGFGDELVRSTKT